MNNEILRQILEAKKDLIVGIYGKDLQAETFEELDKAYELLPYEHWQDISYIMGSIRTIQFLLEKEAEQQA